MHLASTGGAIKRGAELVAQPLGTFVMSVLSLPFHGGCLAMCDERSGKGNAGCGEQHDDEHCVLIAGLCELIA